MQLPLPLNPNSPDVEVIAGPVAVLLRALYPGELDSVIDAPLTIPHPTSATWMKLRLECRDCSWVQLEGGELNLELHQPQLEGAPDLDRMHGVMNQPALFDLEDGSALTAEFAHLDGPRVKIANSMATRTYTISLDSWTWSPPPSKQTLWVGRLEDPRIREDGNLVVCGDTWSTSTCYRFNGNYHLYVLCNPKRETTTLVVDTLGTKLDARQLETDFIAMEFAFGRPLRLDHLLALDDDHRVVGAAGLDFGGWTSRVRAGRCPVPTSRDLRASFRGAAREHLWIPVLFSLVAYRLREDGPDSALLTAVSAYLDSIAAGNIHVSYLLVQIALEALSSAVVHLKSGVLVAEPKTWRAFVKAHEPQIRGFAVDDEAASKLINKVYAAQQAPSTDRVQAALQHFGLRVPKPVLAEVARRSYSAHRYVMAEESTADVQDLANRLALVQTLLVAIVAKHIGFKGPIIGWEWLEDEGRQKVPDWWAWEESDEARRKYMIVPKN